MMATEGFQSSSYPNDHAPSTGSADNDAPDSVVGSIFLSNYKKHDDLKVMLDSNRDNLKLEAMKRIIGMIAKGRNASELFPAVVKNVASKNVELKKLVYVYLARYAEEQQDLALLSIASFQKALKDPNQLIRASALRVLSSIRVPIIIPIMMLAIKDAVMDLSAFVRKTAAHAIPKLYRLDPEQKDQLVDVIEKLLSDKTTLVAGSAIEAFEEVCPERIDLIHRNYRKICQLLVDVEEWGQVVILNMLARYVRTQFVDPDQRDNGGLAIDGDEEGKKFFTSSSETESSTESDEETEKKRKKKGNKKKKKPEDEANTLTMDPDHRLLLRVSRPLLHSRNSAVVMAVVQLYYHCAPKNELGIVAKALIRLLRCHKEIQYTVLHNIITMSLERKSMFEPYLKSFYVFSTDATHVKLLKLEVLTNLATETTISTILKEFQTYVSSADRQFAAATIGAIGRCASSIPEVTDSCLSGLVNLLSHKNEVVVGESVVVIKKLLQMQSAEHKDIIVHLARIVDDVSLPMARASIIWLIGEYNQRVVKYAPDVLRKMAKNFTQEDNIVKLQTLNLAAKLCLQNPKQCKLLAQYVFNLAKYDQNYDVRDRSRFLRHLVMPAQPAGDDEADSDNNTPTNLLAKYAKKILLSSKPAPLLESKFKGDDKFQLCTLSHLLQMRTNGYRELPEWPEVAPDPSVRDVEPPPAWDSARTAISSSDTRQMAAFRASASARAGDIHADREDGKFYSDEDEDEDDEEDDDESDESSEESDDEGEEETEEEGKRVVKTKKSPKRERKQLDYSDEEDSDESDDDDDEQDEAEEDSDGGAKTDSSLSSEGHGGIVAKRQAAAREMERLKREQERQRRHRSDSSDDEDESDTESETESEEDSDESSDDEEATSSDDDHQPSTSKRAQVSPPPKAKATNKGKRATETLLALDEPTTTVAGRKPNTTSNGHAIDLLSSDLSGLDVGVGTGPATGLSTIGRFDDGSVGCLEVLNRFHGDGLSVGCRFTRTLAVFRPRFVQLELIFENHSDVAKSKIRIDEKKMKAGMEMDDLEEIETLGPKSKCCATISIDFDDTTNPAQFVIGVETAGDGSTAGRRLFPVEIRPACGELVRPHTMTVDGFRREQAQLGGMATSSASVAVPAKLAASGWTGLGARLARAVGRATNLAQVSTNPSDPLVLFAGQTVAHGNVVLLDASWDGDASQLLLKVHCEKMALGSMLLREIQEAVGKELAE